MSHYTFKVPFKTQNLLYNQMNLNVDKILVFYIGLLKWIILPYVIAYTYNPNILKAEANGLLSEASLDYTVCSRKAIATE